FHVTGVQTCALPIWNFVGKSYTENRCCLHIHRNSTDGLEVLFKLLVVFPYSPVGGIDRAGPVIPFVISDRCRNSFLQSKGRQGRYFRRKIIVGRSFATDGRNRKY